LSHRDTPGCHAYGAPGPDKKTDDNHHPDFIGGVNETIRAVEIRRVDALAVLAERIILNSAVGVDANRRLETGVKAAQGISAE